MAFPEQERVSPKAIVEAVNRGLERGAHDFGVIARSILCCIRSAPGNKNILFYFLRLSITCELWSSRRFIQNVFYAAINHVADLSENKFDISGVQTVTFLSCDWPVSIHFVCFCF